MLTLFTPSSPLSYQSVVAAKVGGFKSGAVAPPTGGMNVTKYTDAACTTVDSTREFKLNKCTKNSNIMPSCSGSTAVSV